jgi:amidase
MVGYVKEEYGHRFFAKAVNSIHSIVAGYDELFKEYDVLVLPTIKFKPLKIPTSPLSVTEYLQKYLLNAVNTVPYNVTGHPSISVNAGFSEGLPVGMMIVGRHWEDDVVMNVAQAVEQQRD